MANTKIFTISDLEQDQGVRATVPGTGGTANVNFFWIDSSGKIAVGPGPTASTTGPDPSAQLDLQGTIGGFLWNRLTTTERNALVTTTGAWCTIANTTDGELQMWSGAAWVPIASLVGGAWLVGGNSLAAAGVFGSKTAQDLRVVTNNTRRMTILSTGQVSVGPADPSALDAFDVADSTGSSVLSIPLTGNVAAVLRRDQASAFYLQITNTSANAAARASVRFSGDTEQYSIGVTSSGATPANSLLIRDETANLVRGQVASNGAFAWGVNAPGNWFEVQDSLGVGFAVDLAGTEVARASRSQNTESAFNVQNSNAGAGAFPSLQLSGNARGYSLRVYSPASAKPNVFALNDFTAAADRIIVNATGQVAVGASLPDASAGFDLSQITTLGMGMPVVPDATLLAIANPLAGLTAFGSTSKTIRANVGTAGVPDWRKVAGGALVFATCANAQSIVDNAAAAAVTTWTEVTDTASAFNATTGVFTAPIAGFYQFSVGIEFAAAAATLAAAFRIGVFIGGVVSVQGAYANPVAALSTKRQVQVTYMVQLAAGALVDFRAFQNSGGNIALSTDATTNYLSIALMS